MKSRSVKTTGFDGNGDVEGFFFQLVYASMCLTKLFLKMLIIKRNGRGVAYVSLML